jgi:polar amino acid transport system substrate-binding protein
MKYYINMFLLTIILFITFLTLLNQVHAENKITITLATDSTWSPMEMVDENKNIIGFDIDYLNAIAKEVDINVIYKNVAWDGIFEGIGTGKYDAIILSVTITDERKKVMDFSKPYVNVGQVLIIPRSVKNIKNLSDLKGQNVGAQIGTMGSIEIKKVKSLQLKSYDEIGLAFEDLMSGRIRGVVCDLPTTANYVLQRKEYKEFLK